MLISRDAFLQSSGMQTKKIPMPDMGKDAYVCVRTLTLAEHEAYVHDYFRPENEDTKVVRPVPGYRGRLLVLTMVDDDGQPYLRDGDEAEIEKHAALHLNKIFQAAFELSGLGDELGAADELEKKSESSETSTDLLSL